MLQHMVRHSRAVTGQVSRVPRDGRVRGQVVVWDRKASLVGERGEAGGRDGHGLHWGHRGVHDNALATVRTGDRSPGHLVVGDFHVFS